MNKDKEIEFDLLKQIINNEDPIGLIDYDIPDSLNEYEAEINEILNKDVSGLNKEQLGDWIHDVFTRYFTSELAGDKQIYYKITEKFLRLVDKEKI